jgi:uncharacterized MAPEG superfamily protein
MTPELTALTLAALWQIVHFTIYSVSAQKQVGTRYALSARDEPRQLTGFAGRAQRAMNNHFEGLILFSIAALVLTFSDKADEVTAALSLVYLAARILYLPAYLMGLNPWRSAIWGVGLLATVLMLLKALF